MKNENQIKLQKAKRVAFIASIITLLLAILKYFIGHFYNNEVLIADSIHSFADTAAILASAFGLYLAGRPKNNRFPYGLYKAETLALLFIGLFIGYAGIDLFQEGYTVLTSPPQVINIQPVPIITAAVSTITAIFIAIIEFRTANEIQSLSLKANARESFWDIITSLIVLAGILLPAYNIPYIQGIIIIFISLIVCKIGIENTLHSIFVLLDADTNKDLRIDIEDTVNTIRGIKGVNHIKIRETGPFKMVDMEIVTAPSATVFAIDQLSQEIKTVIYDEFSNIEGIFIDVKPAKNEIYRAAIPVQENNGLNSKVFSHFGKAKYYIIIKIDGTKIEIDDFYLNEFLSREKHIGLHVIKSIIHYNIDLLFTKEIGEISFHILRDNLIDIYKITEEDITVQNVVDNYHGKKLNKINKPTHASDS